MTAEYDTDFPNLGLLYLAGALRAWDPAVEVRYVEGRITLDEHLRLLESFRPELYGISFASLIAPLAYKAIRAVKERLPELLVVAGGSHPTVMFEEVLRQSPADACILGEGEETIVDLAAALRDGRPWRDTSGVAYLQGDEVISTPPRALINDLDQVAFPAWDLISHSDYTGFQIRKHTPPGAVVFSRGCPYNCTFCSNPVWKQDKPWFRRRSPEGIAAEVDLLYQRGVREIFIASDEFNVGLQWNLDVCEAIASLGHKDLVFQCNLTANQVTGDLVEALRSINCWMVRLGIESGSQRVLDGIRKPITLAQVEDTCRRLKKGGIKVYGYFMMYQAWEENGAVCIETPEEVDRTLAFVWQLRRRQLVDYISWTVATPYPGSQLYRLAKRHRLLERRPAHTFAGAYDFTMSLPGVTERTMKRSQRKGLITEGLFALTSGGIEWRAWKRILEKVKCII